MKRETKGKIKAILDMLAFTGTIIVGLAFILAVMGLMGLGFVTFLRNIGLRTADDLPPAEPSEGVAWIMPEVGEVSVWLSPVCAGEIETALPVYTEGDGPVPEWYRPDEPMSAVWIEPNHAGYGSDIAQTAENGALEPRMITSADHFGDVNNMVDGAVDDEVNAVDGDVNALQSDSVDYNAPEGIDAGGIDWNLCTTLWGWDGHGMELWEMELFSKILYLEFWGCSPECCEAGADAILRLWESEYYGRTLFETVSAVTEDGAWVFSTYPAVWETEYDPDGLAEMRELCEERFCNGPEWCAEFFRTGYYHPWAVPCYELDGVYFSTFAEGTR